MRRRRGISTNMRVRPESLDGECQIRRRNDEELGAGTAGRGTYKHSKPKTKRTPMWRRCDMPSAMQRTMQRTPSLGRCDWQPCVCREVVTIDGVS